MFEPARGRLTRCEASNLVQRKATVMLWMIAAIFLILWGVGFLTSYTVGGLIHILLLLALVTVLIRVIQGRKVLP
jgi:hypothetical protein